MPGLQACCRYWLAALRTCLAVCSVSSLWLLLESSVFLLTLVGLSANLGILETWVETGLETGVETGSTNGVETSVETGLTNGVETGVETGLETGVETGVETGPETGLKTSKETGLETRVETEGEIWLETVVETGVETWVGAVVPLVGCLGGEVLAVETGNCDLCLQGDFSLGGASLGLLSSTSSG